MGLAKITARLLSGIKLRKAALLPSKKVAGIRSASADCADDNPGIRLKNKRKTDRLHLMIQI
jgi:hypothetical protein